MGEKKLKTYSIDEYLKQEESSEVRHEYHRGYISAMAGGTLNHGLIVGNTIGTLHSLLKGKKCIVFSSDVKVYIDSTNSFVYPDVSVVCGEIESSEYTNHAFVNPVVIFEVLSKGTANYDRGEKFHKYRTLPSLIEYILIDQDTPFVTVYRKAETGFWRIDTISGLEQAFRLHSLDVEVKMSDLYSRINDLPSPKSN